MPSFKVPCASCEHQVLIKDAKQIGTKVECPKCKYRFKVEEPAGGIPADEAKPEKGKKPAAEGDDANKKKKKSKKVVAIVVGVLAVGVLAAVGFAVMGGGKKPPPPVARGGGGGSGGGGTSTVGAGNTTVTNDKDPKEDPDKKDTVPKAVSVKSTLPISDREPSNLLPGQTVSFFRFDFEKLRQTPIVPALFDPLMQGMFRDSFGFHVEEIAVYYHAYVGNAREPFGVIRIKEPSAEKDILSRMALADGSKKVRGRSLYAFRSNPFITGVSNVFTMTSLFGEMFSRALPRLNPQSENHGFGIFVYDNQHIVVGDLSLLETYLNDLDSKGYPKFLSSVNPPAGSDIQFAENPLYLSINPELKKLLKNLGSENHDPPAVLYAERFAQGSFDPKIFKPDYQPFASILDPILNRTLYLGANVVTLTTKQLTANVRAILTNQSDALEVVKVPLTPALMFSTQALTMMLGTPVEFRNMTPGANVAQNPMGPNYPGSGTGPGPMGPGPGPGSGSGSMKPPGPGGKLPGSGSGMMPPGGPKPPGGGLQPPGGPGGGFQPPGGPGPMGMPPGGPIGGTPGPKVNNLPASFVELGLTDQIITVKIDLHWSDQTFRSILAPRLYAYASSLKGKMAVYSSEIPFHGLSAAVPKMLKLTKQFPQGASDRQLGDTSRMGLKYPPYARVSFFAELLPYMGRNQLYESIDKNAAWYDEVNLAAAETWVPEFLVPSYPQSAWRATSTGVPDGRTLGGTNYVAIAGIGYDAPRYNPNNPLEARKVGIIGYDWGSKVEEVTDGLSNTILFMQTPPGMSQPWIAGGGATVRGLNEKDPMHGFRHTYGTPNGQEGTYAMMGDCSVRFISGKISPEVLLAMSTRAGGEDLAGVIDKEAPRIDPARKFEIELKEIPKTVEPTPPKAKSDDPVTPPKSPDPKKETAPARKFEVAPEPRMKK